MSCQGRDKIERDDVKHTRTDAAKTQSVTVLSAVQMKLPEQSPKEWLWQMLARSKVQCFDEAVTLSPEMAKELLALNTGNRTLNRSRVELLKRAMAEGRWQYTHQGIAVSDDFILLDGQHRLTAAAESGVTIKVKISFGCKSETQIVLDQQKSRNAADFISMDGLKYPVVRQSVAAHMLRQKERSLRTTIDPEAILLFHNTLNQVLLENAVYLGSSITRQCPASPAAVGFYHILTTTSKDHSNVYEFANKILTGADLPVGSAILKFRTFALPVSIKKTFAAANLSNHDRISRISGALVLTWNYWHKKRGSDLVWTDTFNLPKAV